MDDPTLLDHLRELADAQLVTATSAETFEFRHALMREAVYATLLKSQRVTYHGLVAEALENSSGEATLSSERAADLAHHYREAANWPKVLEYARQAGDQAQQMYAPREAVQHFSHALEAARQMGQAPDPRLLRERGQAYETIGEFEPARADYEQGLALARAAGAAAAEWQALLDLGFLWAGRDYARTGEYLQQALALARASGDPQTVAKSLNRLGNWLVNIGRIEPGLQMHNEALAIFQAQGSLAGMAATHDLLGMSYSLNGNLPSGAEHVEQASVLFREAGNWRGLVASLGAHSSLIHVCDTLPWTPQTLQNCQQMALEAERLARQIGWLAGLAEVQWMFALSLGAFGALGEALASAHGAVQTASEIDHRQWMSAGQFALGSLHLMLLEPESAVRHLERACALAAELGSAWWIGYGGAFLAMARLRLGQAARARAELQAAAAAIGLKSDWATQAPRTLIERYLVWGWAETARVEGQPAEALALAERLLDSAVNPENTPIPHLLKLKGEALLDLDRLDEAETALRHAADGARAHDTRPILWQIELARARLAQRQEKREAARRALAAARRLIDELADSLEPPMREAFRDRAAKQIDRL